MKKPWLFHNEIAVAFPGILVFEIVIGRSYIL